MPVIMACQDDGYVGYCYVKGLYWEPQTGNPKNIAGI